jgi:hypothetical protein
MIKSWRRIDPDKELGVAAFSRACGYMSDEDYLKIKAECMERKRQKELFERKQNVKRIRTWRRIISRAGRR